MSRAAQSVLGLALFVAGSSLAAADVQNLVDNSPFLPAGYNSSSAATPEDKPPEKPEPPPSLEFLGVYTMRGDTFVMIRDVRTQRGLWTEVGTRTPQYAVEEFRAADNAVVLRLDGKPLILKLKDASDRPMPVQTAPSPQQNAGQPQQPPAQPTVRPVYRQEEEQQQPARPIVRRRAIPVPNRDQ